METKSKRGPVWSKKVGGVSAAVFENDRISGGKRFRITNVVVERRYQKDGEWKRTSSFNGVMDLVKLRSVVDETISHLLAGENESTAESAQEAPQWASASPDVTKYRLSFSGVDLAGGVA